LPWKFFYSKFRIELKNEQNKQKMVLPHGFTPKYKFELRCRQLSHFAFFDNLNCSLNNHYYNPTLNCLYFADCFIVFIKEWIKWNGLNVMIAFSAQLSYVMQYCIKELKKQIHIWLYINFHAQPIYYANRSEPWKA